MKSIAILLSLLAGPWAIAQQATPQPHFILPGEATAHYKVETVLTGLDHPCGLALRPAWSREVAAELFLIERGAGRILKMATDSPGVTQEVIVGFPLVDVEEAAIGGFSDEGPRDQGGPLGLLFLTHNKLVVCGYGQNWAGENGSQLLNVYRLPAADLVLTADQTDHQGEPDSTDQRALEGGGWSCGLAKIGKAIFVASGGNAQGWLLKGSLEANRLTDLQTFIATTKQTGLTGPVGLAVHPQPRLQYLVVGQMGRIDVPRDSGLAFYGPKSGRLAMNLTTGLHDLVGLSYSLKGNLYGIDLAWQAESDGGVYRLDDALLAGKPTCRAIKIAPARRPTSMVFAPDGSLYVTAWGPAPAETKTKSDQKTGVLLKITGEW